MKNTITALFIFLIAAVSVLAVAPVLDPVGDQAVDENTELSIILTATDDDGDALTFDTNATSGAISAINDTAAEFTWTPTYDDAGDYDVEFTVTDGTDTDSETITITVNNVNRAPVIEPIGDNVATEGEDYTYQVEASDEDDDTLTYSLTTSPAGMTISSTGLISWTPAATGVEDVTVEVSDGDLTDDESFQITVLAPAASISVGNLALGDEDTERDEQITGSITITNTGTTSIDDLTLTSTAGSVYNVTFVGVPSSLAAGASASVTVEAYVPLNHDAGSLSGDIFTPEALTIGTLTVSGTSNGENPTDTATLSMQAANKLIINDADVYVESQREGVNDGDDVEDVKPGDTIRVEVEAENKFRDTADTDWDIENVNFVVVIDDGDLDIDEDDDMGDIKADDTETGSIEFDIDEDVDEDSYDMIITVDGEDENGARHGETYEINLRVERERHDIKVDDVFVTPQTILCDGTRTVRVTVDITNVGRDDERYAAIKVESDELNYEKKVSSISLDQDDSTSRTFDVDIPEDISGTFAIYAYVYYDNIELTDDDAGLVTVNDCSDFEPEEEEEEETEPPIVITPPTQPPVSPPTTVEDKGSSFTQSTTYMVVLVILVVILLVVLILLLVRYFAKY